MDHIGKLDGVTDEEHRQVIAYQIPIALVGIKLGSKATWIPEGLWTMLAMNNCGEANENGGFLVHG